MHGKARMLTLSPYFSARAFIAVKSLTVVPHREATLTTSVGLPAKDLKSALEPSILLAEKSMSVDMLTAARAATPREEMPALKAEPSACPTRSILVGFFDRSRVLSGCASAEGG